MKKFTTEQINAFVSGLSVQEYTNEGVEIAALYESVVGTENAVVLSEEEVAVLESELASLEARINFIRQNTAVVTEESLLAEDMTRTVVRQVTETEAEVVTEGQEPAESVQAPEAFSDSELAAFMVRAWNGPNNDKMIEEFRSQLKVVKSAEDRATLVGRLDAMIGEAESIKADPSAFIGAVNARRLVAGNVEGDTQMSPCAQDVTAGDLGAYIAGLTTFRDRVNGMSVPSDRVGKDS